MNAEERGIHLAGHASGRKCTPATKWIATGALIAAAAGWLYVTSPPPAEDLWTCVAPMEGGTWRCSQKPLPMGDNEVVVYVGPRGDIQDVYQENLP